jgi:hypothetical protein
LFDFFIKDFLGGNFVDVFGKLKRQLMMMEKAYPGLRVRKSGNLVIEN